MTPLEWIFLLFGTLNLTSDLPAVVASGSGHFGAATELETQMPGGYLSYAYYYDNGGDQLCLAHQGHRTLFTAGGMGQAATAMTAQGCDLLTFEMVGLGRNYMPVASHDSIVSIPDWPLLRYHMQPIREALNWALTQKPYSKVGMFGHSGGGWATTLYSALDARIDASVEVAGTLPSSLLSHSGDAEQAGTGALTVEAYEQLYVLGATPVGRTRRQLLTPDDPCCFSAADYGPGYAARIRHLGDVAPGEIEFIEITDRPGSHEVTGNAIVEILDAFGLTPGDPPAPVPGTCGTLPPPATTGLDNGDPGYTDSGGLGGPGAGVDGDSWYTIGGPDTSAWAQWDLGCIGSATYDVVITAYHNNTSAFDTGWIVFADGIEAARGTYSQSHGVGIQSTTVTQLSLSGFVTVQMAGGASGQTIFDHVQVVLN